jgi:hypothetical protein
MSDVQMWELLAGFISATFLLPLIQQPRWSNGVRALITFAWSVAAGLGTAYFSGGFAGTHDLRTGVTAVLTVLISAIATYHGFAKPIGIAPTIEKASSPGGG